MYNNCKEQSASCELDPPENARSCPFRGKDEDRFRGGAFREAG
jgi:hypothetical protein